MLRLFFLLLLQSIYLSRQSIQNFGSGLLTHQSYSRASDPNAYVHFEEPEVEQIKNFANLPKPKFRMINLKRNKNRNKYKNYMQIERNNNEDESKKSWKESTNEDDHNIFVDQEILLNENAMKIQQNQNHSNKRKLKRKNQKISNRNINCQPNKNRPLYDEHQNKIDKTTEKNPPINFFFNLCFNKNNEIIENGLTNTKYQHGTHKPKFERDCNSYNKNRNRDCKDQETTVHNTELTTESPHNHIKNMNKHDVHAGVENYNENIINIQQQVFKVGSSRDSDLEITTKRPKSDHSKKLTETIENDLNERTETSKTLKMPIPEQTEAPILGSLLLTDSPIHNIKIENSEKKAKKLQINKNEIEQKIRNSSMSNPNNNEIVKSVRSNDTANANELLVNHEDRTNSKPLRDESINEFNNENAEDTKDMATTTEQNLMKDVLENMPSKDSQRSMDQVDSENRLYTYVTKLDRKSRKRRNKKAKSQYMEPIAYEAFRMSSFKNSKNSKTSKRARKTQSGSKPKRFVELRSLKSTGDIPQVTRRRYTKTTTTPQTTTTRKTTKRPTHYAGNSLFADEEFNFDNPRASANFQRTLSKGNENLGRRKIVKIPKNGIKKSEFVGVNHFTFDDPCLDSEDSIGNSKNCDANRPQYDEPDDFDISINNNIKINDSDQLQNNFRDSDIHGIRDDCYGDRACDDGSNEVKYDGDQYFEIADKIVPVPLPQFNELCT